MTNIFISYAHKDEEVLEEAMPHFESLVRSNRASKWSDRDIGPGSPWQEEIYYAIEAADVAVLLVTPEFLASRFIMDEELPRLLQKKVVWIPVKACYYQGTALKEIEAAHPPGKPLHNLPKAKRDAAWVEILKKIDSLAPPVSRPPSRPEGEKTFRLPPRNPLFTGRDAEIEQIHRTLWPTDGSPASRVVVLHGIGGKGKTQTAVEYAHRHEAEYSRIFTIRAERPGEFEAQMASLAERLKLEATAVTVDISEQYRAVREWLGTHGDWLLILESAEGLVELQPKLPSHSKGRTLVTTRERPLPTFGVAISLKHLDDETGTLLLLRCAGKISPGGQLKDAPTVWRQSARKLSNRLGGMALAIDQAGAYISEAQIKPDQYLELYKKQGRKLLHVESGERDTVTRTYLLALEKLEESAEFGPAAAQLIYMCAFLAPNPIPEQVFTNGCRRPDEPLGKYAADEVGWINVHRAATRYSLLQRDSDRETFLLHPIVSDVIVDIIGEEKRLEWTERVVEMVNHAFREVKFESWSARSTPLFPHLMALHEAIQKLEIATPAACLLLNQGGKYLWNRKDYDRAAILFADEVAVLRRIHGRDHLEVFKRLFEMAERLERAGRLDAAVTALDEAVAISRRLPEVDESTLAGYVNMFSEVNRLQAQIEASYAHRGQVRTLTRPHRRIEPVVRSVPRSRI